MSRANVREVLEELIQKTDGFSIAEKRTAVTKLVKEYGADAVIGCLASSYWYNTKYISDIFDVKNILKTDKKDVRTVGMFYNRMYNGGVERVISLLTPILLKVGYKVVVITDEPEDDRDYELPAEAVRVVLENGSVSIKENYSNRLDAWVECIEKHKIDVVIYHAWNSEKLFWDMCSIKNSGAAFITHMHGVFITGLIIGWMGLQETEYTNRHADAVVTLSRDDEIYMRRFNKRTFQVNNPCAYKEKAFSPAPLDSHNILWLGRFEDLQKNPRDALYIMRKVLDKVPDAVLNMVGHAEPEKLEEFNEIISDLQLSGHVQFPGFDTEVMKYYQDASVFLMTPSYEGYAMTVLESFINGVPIVTYELDYMTTIKNSKAAIQVPWRDIDSAAEAIADLLTNDEKRKTMGAAARAEMAELEKYDYEGKWQEILECCIGKRENDNTNISQEELDSILNTVDLGFRQMASSIRHLSEDENSLKNGNYYQKKIIKNLEAQQVQIYNSYRYRIGSAVMYLPSKLKCLLNRKRK